MTTVYLPDNCMECGMCCQNHTDPKWIEVTLEDAISLPKAAYTGGDIEVFSMVQDETGKCNQLKGIVGDKCACTVYELRPKICRQVERGSSICLESIIRFRRKNDGDSDRNTRKESS